MRLIFMGTAELAATVLAKLAEGAKWEIAAVVSQPDRPRGRDLEIHPTPAKVEALNRGLRVLQPDKARNPLFLKQLEELNPDLIAVAAYGQLLPPSILELPRYGCLNVHLSLLPRYRGAAPIQ